MNAKGGVRVFVDGKPWRMRGAAFGSCGRLNAESVPIELSRKAYSLHGWFWRAASEDFDVTPIDDDWGYGAPSVLGLSSKDRFAVSWEGELRIEVPGTYRFDLNVDDLGWLSIDGQDIWSGKGKGTSQGVWLDAGQHKIRFVAFDFFGPAHAHLKVHSSSPDLGGLSLPAERCSAPPMP